MEPKHYRSLIVLIFSALALLILFQPMTARGLQPRAWLPTAPREEGEEPDPEPNWPENHPGARFFADYTIGPDWLRVEGIETLALGPQSLAPPPSYAVALATGSNHTCALTDVGGVRCWGDNYLGQLGDGRRIYRNLPVDVLGLTQGVVAISSSNNHTCALTEQGGVKCWGYNLHGELGDGTITHKAVPVDVQGLRQGVIAISAGGFHTCALMEDRGVKCWGVNWHGQLGDGTTKTRLHPVDVHEMQDGVLAISAGRFHTCGLMDNGVVRCWGYNRYGQQGDGSTEDQWEPHRVSGLDHVVAVGAGALHTCAQISAGDVYCWGDNSEGQLGDGTNDMRVRPKKVSDLSGPVTGIVVAGYHTCALIDSRAVTCWGDNWAGQIGDGTTIDRNLPINTQRLPDSVQRISGGASHTCAIVSAGEVMCWGSNFYGQLGNAEDALQLEPAYVAYLSRMIQKVQAGGGHACALTDQGETFCWGNNYFGQLGDGTTRDRLTAVPVSNLPRTVVDIALGTFHSCALLADASLRCWGENEHGQVGDGTRAMRTTPVNVSGLAGGVVSVSAGSDHTCALTAAGGVKCWGKNTRGRLGDGTGTERLTPVDVIGLDERAIDLAVGETHSCVVTESGGVKCWGSNVSGRLGDGTSIDRVKPVDVIGMQTGVAEVTAGVAHTCARLTSGEIKCWGANSSGQLGDASTINRPWPVTVLGLSAEVQQVVAGGEHTCALAVSGSVYCWGNNWNGQLGDGSTVPNALPVKVSGLPGPAIALTAGYRFTCAQIHADSPVCWGANGHAQLGTGNPPWETTPVLVLGVQPAALTINHPTGSAGSFFSLHGTGFPPGRIARITINGQFLAADLVVDGDGETDFRLDTSQAEAGGYLVTVRNAIQATTRFDLLPDAPLRQQETSGPIYLVPPGIAYTADFFLPLSQQGQ